MGNELSSNNRSKVFSDKSLEDFDAQTEFVEEMYDKSFDSIRIFKRLNPSLQLSQLIMEKSSYSEDKNEFATLYSESQTRLPLLHANLLQFLGFDFINSNEMCGKAMRSRLFFEYYYHDLGKEIDIRAQSEPKQFFEESELMYMLKTLIEVCSFLQENQLFHGDLRPHSIKLTRDGIVKIGDHGLINPMKNGFYKTMIRADHAFLSPIQLSILMKGSQAEIKYNTFKADVFSLGLTILSGSTLSDVSVLYDWDLMLIKEFPLSQLIDQAAERYSQDFINLLSKMVEINDDQRPDFVQLRTQFQQFSQQKSTSQHQPFSSGQKSALRLKAQLSDTLKQTNPNIQSNQANLAGKSTNLLQSQSVIIEQNIPPFQKQQQQYSQQPTATFGQASVIKPSIPTVALQQQNHMQQQQILGNLPQGQISNEITPPVPQLVQQKQFSTFNTIQQLAQPQLNVQQLQGQQFQQPVQVISYPPSQQQQQNPQQQQQFLAGQPIIKQHQQPLPFIQQPVKMQQLQVIPQQQQFVQQQIYQPSPAFVQQELIVQQQPQFIQPQPVQQRIQLNQIEQQVPFQQKYSENLLPIDFQATNTVQTVHSIPPQNQIYSLPQQQIPQTIFQHPPIQQIQQFPQQVSNINDHIYQDQTNQYLPQIQQNTSSLPFHIQSINPPVIATDRSAFQENLISQLQTPPVHRFQNQNYDLTTSPQSSGLAFPQLIDTVNFEKIDNTNDGNSNINAMQVRSIGYSEVERNSKKNTFQSQDFSNTSQNDYVFLSGQKKSVKFTQDQDLWQADRYGEISGYKYSGQNFRDNSQSLERATSTLKKSMINRDTTDLDRRVSEAIELTRRTIRKNQQVPNVFSSMSSPIQQRYDKLI